jgi:hypothetical protein
MTESSQSNPPSPASLCIDRGDEPEEEETTRQEPQQPQEPEEPAASTAQTTMPNPRVGGGTDGDSWWTGGANINPRTRKASILACRPSNVKTMLDIEKQIKGLITEEYRLGLPTEKAYKITLTRWIKQFPESSREVWTGHCISYI